MILNTQPRPLDRLLTRGTDPATSEAIASLPDLGAKSCDDAVQSALKAFAELKRMTGKSRGELLRRWFTLVNETQDDIAAIITAENGKTLAEARGEVRYAADFLDWFAGEAPRVDGTVRKPARKQDSLIDRL